VGNQNTPLIESAAQVVDRREVAEGIYRLVLRSPEIAGRAAPGQFVNIRCGESCLPLLRRPFSISRVAGDSIELLFNVIGQGTRMMSSKRAGDTLDVLGPLGSPFGIAGNYETAVLVAGGLGIAPFPFLTDFLLNEKKKILTLIGARSAGHITEQYLKNVQVATDDGSRGLKGTVVDLLKTRVGGLELKKAKIFGCGPTPMLKALAAFASSSGIDCELSLEGDMACGMGICQGCPVERTDGKRKYALVCTDGPTFNSKDIILR
jgi:dihydroorotate dehydrogenase electron transfer subunit